MVVDVVEHLVGFAPLPCLPVSRANVVTVVLSGSECGLRFSTKAATLLRRNLATARWPGRSPIPDEMRVRDRFSRTSSFPVSPAMAAGVVGDVARDLQRGVEHLVTGTRR